jgi:SAM-dependent methyltransferase
MKPEVARGGTGHPVEPSTYDPDYFVHLFAVEDRHFWFRARNRTISRIAEQLVAGLAPGYRVLEVGCGNGNTLRVLEQICRGGTVIGMDVFAEGLPYARGRVGCGLVRADIRRPPFTARFQLIGIFDVLEHLPDDRRVLNDLHAMLDPGGGLLLTVPAHPALWSYFDRASCHRRRYEPEELENKLSNAGFHVEYLTQYMSTIFPLVWLGRRVAFFFGKNRTDTGELTHGLARQELRIVPVLNGLLTFLLTQEIRLIARRRRLLIGTSLLAIARKAQKES